MRKIFILFICFIGRFLVSLRYKVKIKGLEKLNEKNFNKNSGIVLLPNHPAMVDPIILTVFLWPKYAFRPLVVEYIYRQMGIREILKMIKALSIPNLETSMNEVKIKKAEEVIEEVIEGVKNKKNFLLYPSGRMKHTGKEILGGASGAHNVLKNCPGANVLLIRTTGLWGSSFSRAIEGKSPDFKKTLLKNLLKLLKNGIFFMPRRKVLIEAEIGKDLPVYGSRIEFNRFLERWYNRYPHENAVVETEPLYLVSYSFWKEDFLEIKRKKEEKKKKRGKADFETEIEKEIYDELSKRHPDAEINSDTDLARDLGMDSLDISDLISFIASRYDTGELHPADIVTVQDIIEVIEGKKSKSKVELPEDIHWPEYDKKRPVPHLPEGSTIMEVFFKICDELKDAPAVGDDITGVLSFKKLKLSAIALSYEIKKLQGENIAILMPASSAAYILILAVLIAGKVPVMLNWTLGPRYLEHMISLSKASVVISSWKFLERLGHYEFGDEIVSKIQLIEDYKKNLTFTIKAKAKIQSLFGAKLLMRLLNLNKISENASAVILFTSGTETVPKGVPLTHKNILFDLKSSMKYVELHRDEVFLGALPPFHSFGFTVAGLFSILAGMKIAYYPDPTDSYALVKVIEKWKVTLLCLAPSFLRGVLQAGSEEQLESVRLFVTGAEKTPDELYEKVEKMGKDLIEGYGITECAPILTLNRPDKPKRGVGHPISNVEFCTIDPETEKLLNPNQEGELCVKGDNVFKGYLGDRPSPFIEIEGEKWYKTGDLGYQDKDGYIILSGRLKRFTKIGGEMVSLRALEEAVRENLDVEDEEPQLAVIAKEKEGEKTELYLFTTTKQDKNRINEILAKAGFGRVIKISGVKHIEEIPLLGTGKIDYRFLQNMLEDENESL